MRQRAAILLFLNFLFAPAFAGSERFTAALQTSYQGQHTDLYIQQQDRVRLLIRQAQLEISSQLGLLRYQEGFRCPLTVRFDDAPRPGVEHALAYVQMMGTARGFAQDLVINLDVMAANPGDFDKIFYHEMTHAVLNDAVVSQFQRPLPSWVQEGLAVYISEDGDARVRALAQQVRKSQAHLLLHGLEEPILDYARNYLAFKYLRDKHGINALQAFVRELTQGKLAEAAVEESTGLTWDVFRQKLRDYSLEAYREQARPDF